MRILHYYWSQFDDNFRKGGGIKVYLNNILPFQVKAGHEVAMLNSGVDYSILDRKCHIREVGKNGGIRQYSVYNSPVMAPSKADFYGQARYLTDTSLKNVVGDFLKEQEPLDVVHFHSMEGLSLSVLELKKEFPKIKFFYSVHNYFPFCPQVNLWKNDSENCMDFHNGIDCGHCVGMLPKRGSIQQYYRGITFMKKWGLEQVFDLTAKRAKEYYRVIKAKRAGEPVENETIPTIARGFVDFREKNVEYINRYMDGVLCVSRRVKEICDTMGIRRDLTQCLYIGSDFAKKQAWGPKYDLLQSPFQVAYIGYMRKDKGFYFFLNALKEMEPALARGISVVVAARTEDKDALRELLSLKGKFADLRYFDGYTRENIQGILEGTQLGVVPVLWEDNLPQVAIELKAMGIPVLASSLGGASELSECDAFRFEGGNTMDFIEHIKTIMGQRVLLNNYYGGVQLSTIEEHCAKLEAVYRGEPV